MDLRCNLRGYLSSIENINTVQERQPSLNMFHALMKDLGSLPILIVCLASIEAFLQCYRVFPTLAQLIDSLGIFAKASLGAGNLELCRHILG